MRVSIYLYDYLLKRNKLINGDNYGKLLYSIIDETLQFGSDNGNDCIEQTADKHE